ncbi:hypothetical protein OF83DRAFT_782381 [Amylostereum chailletii]|nr:hypothetical protein OF83DRAFT_782381 [Amylostereum chailletii]
MPVATKSEAEEVYSSLQRRMVESGDWDRIVLSLKYKLNDECWLDTLRGQSKEHARLMDPPSTRELVEHITSTHDDIPHSVRRDIEGLIRQYLEKQFQ